MHQLDAITGFSSSYTIRNLDEAMAAAPLSPEEIQSRLARNALFLSDENQRVWRSLLEQEWFVKVRYLAEKAVPIHQWLSAVERIAEGRAVASDVKQAVFYRSAFRQAQAETRKDDVFSDQVADGLLVLSRYLTAKLRPQHNHFG